MNRNEFDVLTSVLSCPASSQRQLAERAGLSLGTVNATYRSLVNDGLVEDGRISAKGLSALAPYKVDNAVIMAAGLSSRFAPISYEKPKGLLRVRGEVLIERQIQQLHEVGITDIVVVVGYKKEMFFYLEEKYGVHIVVNYEYASRNNNSSLMRVKELLGNTYLCSSDNYFQENPFEPYVWHAYYAAQYSAGPTKEWCLGIGAKDRIDSVSIGGEDAWYMIGHVFFDRAFSSAFVRILEEVYDDPRTHDKLWEEIYLDHIGQLDMVVRRYGDDAIFEFDSLDELREFDPLFLDNLDSEIFDNIVAVLGCKKSEIHDVYPLKQGLTNLSCHFATADGEYVYRHPGVGTEKMINRQAEAEAQALARAIGIDDTFVFQNPRKGWKISRFIPNCRLLDPHDDAQLAQAMALACSLHAQDVTVDRRFDYWEESQHYEALLSEKGKIEIPDFAMMKDQACRLKACVEADGARTCLTHNDFFNLNLLYDQQGTLSLIDWEYAGMSDYASDFGTFVVTCMLDQAEAERALCHYFGGEPTPEQRRHNLAFVGLAGWCWYVWALQKESEGGYVGEWLYTYYRYAKTYVPLALGLYEQAGAETVAVAESGVVPAQPCPELTQGVDA